MLKIIILDYQIERIFACKQSVHRELGMRAIVTQISEPPYLARLDVWERLPVLDIDGLIWSRNSKEAFKKQEVVRLCRNTTKINMEKSEANRTSSVPEGKRVYVFSESGTDTQGSCVVESNGLIKSK